jgi:hypothetical protein
MQNANPSQKRSEEQGSSIAERPAQQSAMLGFASASIIERAAQRLDWTIAFGMRHSTPHGPEEITNERPRPGSRIARASRLGSRGPRGLRLRLISRLYLASVLVGAAACVGIFFLTRSVDEKAIAERARATNLPAKATEATSLIRGLAVMPPAVGTALSASPARSAPASAALDLQAKLSLGPVPPAPSRPEPEVATTPAAKALETTSTLASAVARNRPAVPTLSGAEIAALLARGDWLFAMGDVVSARLLYDRAAGVGEARAAVKLGETFDPAFLSRLNLRVQRADSDMAVFWYRRARELGASDARSRLIRLKAKKEN